MGYILINDGFYSDLKETLVGIGAVEASDELRPEELVSVIEGLQPGGESEGGDSMSLLNLLGLKDFNLVVDSNITKRVLNGNTALKNLTVNSGVTLCGYAFKNCTNLETVKISTGISGDCFNGCKNMEYFLVDGAVSIDNYGFYNMDTKTFHLKNTGIITASFYVIHPTYLIIEGNVTNTNLSSLQDNRGTDSARPNYVLKKMFISSTATGNTLPGHVEIYTDALEGSFTGTVHYGVTLDEFMDIIAEEEA